MKHPWVSHLNHLQDRHEMRIHRNKIEDLEIRLDCLLRWLEDDHHPCWSIEEHEQRIKQCQQEIKSLKQERIKNTLKKPV